jgi:hypothetical protein
MLSAPSPPFCPLWDHSILRTPSGLRMRLLSQPLGYSFDHKGYQCLSFSSKHSMTSRLVIFDGSYFLFAAPISSHPSPPDNLESMFEPDLVVPPIGHSSPICCRYIRPCHPAIRGIGVPTRATCDPDILSHAWHGPDIHSHAMHSTGCAPPCFAQPLVVYQRCHQTPALVRSYTSGTRLWLSLSGLAYSPAGCQEHLPPWHPHQDNVRSHWALWSALLLLYDFIDPTNHHLLCRLY